MKLFRVMITVLVTAWLGLIYSEADAVPTGVSEGVHPVGASMSLSIQDLPDKRVKPIGNKKVSNGVKVAVLDSGSNTAYKEGISLIDNTTADYNGHGTLVARIIKEVCPDTELYIVKVIGGNGLAVNERSVVMGLEWAVSRDVDIVNISLRLKGSAGLYQAVKKAHQRGILIFAAAGNRRAGDPGSHYATDTVAYPARYDEVIAVGALDRAGRVYSDSIEGGEVALRVRGYKGRAAGTSIASAYAAGRAAKLMSENRDKGTQEIKNILIHEAHGR